MATPKDQMLAIADEVRAITDPAERARQLGQLLIAIQDLAPRLKADRQAAVLELRAQPLTFREIGERLGLSAARVDQIAKGK